MNNFIIYSMEIAVSLALFYSAYWLFLKKETFFKLNRFYLVFSVMLSLCLPVLNITIGKDSFINKNLLLPIDKYEQSMIGNHNIYDEIVFSESNNIPVNEKIIKTNDEVAAKSNCSETFSPTVNGGSNMNEKINWLKIISIIYFVGVALFLIRFVANFIWIFGYVLKNRAQQISGMKVIRLEKNISPFSFLNFIFISKSELPDAELNKIISHEKVHIQQKHSVDIILFELLLVFQWFNPFIWFYKNAIKITHEYLADQGTLNSGVDLPEYQYSLLNQVLKKNNFEIASNYNLTIKKRIEMMMKKRSPKLATLKLAIALPVLIFVFSAFAFNTNVYEKNAKNSNYYFPKDTTIKAVSVTVEYLKTLEGEYVSTNDPTRKRTIIFTELLGTLFGNDDGYTYKIIPVGGEEFINPDDKASLIFNSKDKNAINLLLFGKVNLNKVNYIAKINLDKKKAVRGRSMAFTLANVMLQEGIPAAMSYYKLAKDSSNYFLTESDMSYAGYQLMDGGKMKEAIALLKLDTEMFPKYFNAYDSYAEALLAGGDKTKAIDAFKSSLKLNPGSANGLKRLKELGVNTDELTKRANVSIERLKLLEGIYLSTNQPNWVRMIKIEEENGVLIGNDNGYRYKLIAMSDDKFINPDDGVELIFNTKDKNAISFLIFGTINLKKVKSSKEPIANLKDYAGHYLPSKKDTIVRNFEIRESNNKLFRFIEEEPQSPNRSVELEFITDNVFFYTDNSGRSIEFTVDNKKQVTGCSVRRPDGIYTFSKQK